MIDPDSAKFAAFVAGFVVLFAIETLFRKRAGQRSRWQRLGLHTGMAVANAVLIRMLTYGPLLALLVLVEQRAWGLRHVFGLSGWPELIASILVLDAFNYWWHRANHRVRLLWRFHKVHHSDTEMDVTTMLRFHPGELMISAVVKAAWILMWGPSLVAWFVFEALVSLCAQFHHANIDFPNRIDRALRAIIVSPRYHAAHHAVDRRWGDANFANFLSVWDRLFGSYARPADDGATTNGTHALGLPDRRDLAFSPWGVISEPLRDDNLGLPARGDRPGA